MKRKATAGLLLLSILLTATIFGTWAYFSKTFKSEDNIAKAAVFDVDVVNKDGETIADADFDLDEDLYPGMETKEVYQFDIQRNNTELPLEYEVNLKKEGELFKEGSPVVITIERNVEGKWVEAEPELKFVPNSDVEQFRILADWPHSDNDIDFQGLTGKIHLQVIAKQTDGEEPAGPPYYTGAIEFKVTPNGRTYKTSNKEIDFYLNDDGEKVIEVSMGDGEADDPNAFENKVGDFRIVEEDGWFRVYTEKEYYASETQMWRVRPDAVDVSKAGVIRLAKVLGPYLSIESKELYDWYVGKK
ncbi:hypothetical protein GCM10010978_16960 [Compostibacillus humi]|uniref:Uncharacterized protein n=1 Tax=Compostibacillus humi TaxID=1245525 RepID=A0A8J2TL24_9BACI|nr:hypothetical protein [Compostibacillus humi]GFZ75937.1 hypothetical protein GCM10010978_16960 [Compostibacillus humi]HLT54846.1 hypothetical protein [Bacillota bacterium]